jgi:hypothetical protein
MNCLNLEQDSNVDGSKYLYILAEHVEFKPVKK